MQKRFFVWSLFVHGIFFLLVVLNSSEKGQPNISGAYSSPHEEKLLVRGFMPPAVPPGGGGFVKTDYSPGVTLGGGYHVSQVKSSKIQKLHHSTKKIKRVLPKKFEGPQSLSSKKSYSKSSKRINIIKKQVGELSSDKIMASMLAEKNRINKDIRNKYIRSQLDKSVALLEFTRERIKYLDAIRSKIYAGVLSSIPFSPKLETIVKVYQDRKGKIISVSVIKSSGNHDYDKQVVSATYRGSPLPSPVRADLFRDTIVLKFSPQRKF
ncbi:MULTISPECIES: energy transducer TonB [Candidatus Ichthyocystis]|uniref:Putative iron transporter, TolA family n=1 Tax=Candidatus Ichthyocystis hellenicum TaxID=1561003 RepID=A0A0S4M4W4_9BURK|nr:MULTISPECIES: energy transducer TonB [Ichthyocystis]CUT17309.1 putative iron transporter, TolA family [Candidatus Ichthyocystis hellenicum]